MEVILALPILIIPLIFPFISGQMAKCYGRKFWPWFCIGMALPFIANIILLCLPDKSKQKPTVVKAVDNEKIFDHLFINNDSPQRNIDPGNHFAA